MGGDLLSFTTSNGCSMIWLGGGGGKLSYSDSGLKLDMTGEVTLVFSGDLTTTTSDWGMGGGGMVGGGSFLSLPRLGRVKYPRWSATLASGSCLAGGLRSKSVFALKTLVVAFLSSSREMEGTKTFRSGVELKPFLSPVKS